MATDSPLSTLSPPEIVAASPPSTLLNINMTNVTKLNSTNFLMWSRQVQALLDGYDLGGYIDGSIISPPQTLPSSTGTAANPEYSLWTRQDKLIYSALLGAISNSIQPILATTTTSAEIWDTLSSTYAKPSRGHLKQIRQQLKNWTKGARSIEDYIQGFTTRFDQLALLGKPLDHEDKIDYILEGLTEDYKIMVDQLEGHDVIPTLTKVHEKLINHELKLTAMVSASPSIPVCANVAQSRGYSNNNSTRNQQRR